MRSLPLGIDIHIEVPHVPFEKLSNQRVEAMRAVQRKRFERTMLQTNADMGPAKIRKFCLIDETGTNLLKAAMQQMQLGARAYHRILKLAQTIAGLAGIKQYNMIRST